MTITHDIPTENTGKTGPQRPLRRTLRRRAVPLLAVFCILASLIFLAAPLLHRTYQLAAKLDVKLQSFDPLPELTRLPDTVLKNISSDSSTGFTTTHLSVKQSEPDASRRIELELQLSASSPVRDSALARLHMLADKFSTQLEQNAIDILADYRVSLQKSAQRLAADEQTIGRDIDAFRLSHRGALPDDPTSTLGQFQKIVDRLEEKQQRSHVVTQQITRLQDYKKANQANGGRGASPPPQLAPADAPADAPAPVRPGADPEVAALTAQLQLINKQIDEQLTTKGRTEQHPYVVDLRNQQAAMQKKLDAAKERAASGKPAPADSSLPQTAAHTPDSNLLTVDLDLQNAQAEHDALDAEIKTLTAQRDAMQEKVDQVLPIRQQYEKLTSSLESAKRERALVRTRTEDFQRQFGAKPGDEKTAGIVEVAPLTILTTSMLPSSPRFPNVFALALLIAAAVTATLAFILHRTDRTLHSPRDVAATLDLPILGAVSQIRTRGQQRNRRWWRLAGEPAVLLALIILTLGSALLSYIRLSDPAFPHTVQQRGVTSLLFADRGRE